MSAGGDDRDIPADGARGAAIDAFLARSGWAGAERAPLADDASFRRYERVRRGEAHAVLMDAPPDYEDVRPFVAVARLLREAGLSAPEVLAEDAEAGFLLLEDLGDATMTRLLAGGADAAPLYRLAMDALIHLHDRVRTDHPAAAALPRYDRELFRTEAALFVDWYWPAVTGAPCPAPARAAFLDLVADAVALADAVPETLVLRDYHIDNILRLDGRDGVAACGVLDFQDAVIGPAAYDVVSLLEDARHDVPPAVAAAEMQRYLAAFPELDRDEFAAAYAALGAQRALKVLGIFTRLDRRDGKSGYLAHIPRVWRWLEGDLAHPGLAGLHDWLDRHLPPEARTTPASRPGGGVP